MNTYPPMPTRQLLVDLSSGFERHWWGGCPYRTAYHNALSMSFPVGEQLFIDSVRECLPRLPNTPENEPLRAACQQFIAQEATHRRIHALYNEQLDKTGMVNWWEGFAARKIAWGKSLGLHPLNRLAITAALEHMTGTWASIALADAQFYAACEPKMGVLWQWHASEEAEHKAIAFDLYRATGGSEGKRKFWYVWMHLQFLFASHAQTWLNLWRDKSWWWPRTWWGAMSFWWGLTVGPNGMAWRTFIPFAKYLSRHFHPEQIGNRAIEQTWLQTNQSSYRIVRTA